MLGMIWNNGPWEWIIILVVVLIFFGAGKLPKVMAQMGKGVKAFKDGVKNPDEEEGHAIEAEMSFGEEKVPEAEEVKRG
jgi:sec-independent protein translocase protein TatA